MAKRKTYSEIETENRQYMKGFIDEKHKALELELENDQMKLQLTRLSRRMEYLESLEQKVLEVEKINRRLMRQRGSKSLKLSGPKNSDEQADVLNIFAQA